MAHQTKNKKTIVDIVQKVLKHYYSSLERILAPKNKRKFKNDVHFTIAKMNNIMKKFYKNSNLVIEDLENIEKFTCQTEDNVTLKGLIYTPNKNSKKYIVAAHWFAGHKYWGLYHSLIFRELGYNIIVFDFRGHGESDKSQETLGRLEVKDFLAILQYVKQNIDYEYLGLIGTSMGAYVVNICSVAFNNIANDYKIKFAISDSSYGSVETLLVHIKNNYLWWFSKRLFLKSIKKTIGTIKNSTGSDITEYNLFNMLTSGSFKPEFPILFIHAMSDRVTHPVDSTRLAFLRAKTHIHDDLLIFGKAQHTQALRQHFATYAQKIISFENKIIKNAEMTERAIKFFGLDQDSKSLSKKDLLI